MKINKFAILICFILVFSTFMSSFTVSSKIVTNSIEKTNISNSFLEKNGYIIKLKGDPLFVFEKNLIKSNFYGKVEEKFNDHKNQLLSLHSTAKEKILDLVDCSCESDCFFIEEFTNVFNGFAVSNIPEKIVNLIESLPFVEGVYPNRIFKVNLQDSVPLINADDVWELQNNSGINVTGEGVTVAVLDTGIDYNHSKFGGGFGPGYQVVDGYDFVKCDNFNSEYECDSPRPEDDDPMDDNGHGTHCAGIVVGVAPNVSLYAYKVLNRQGYGDESWLFSALDKVVDPNQDGDFSDHVDIVSMSFGLFSPSSSDNPSHPDDILSRTVDGLVDSGIVFVAAAGNNGPFSETIQSPACSRKSIAVGSTDKDDSISSFSSRGPTKRGTIKPDVLAPGRAINSTWLNNGYSVEDGTSMSCPHVAGVAALILQMHPDWTPLEVKMAIRNTAVDLGYIITTQGWGRVDAYAAVNLSEAPPIAFLNTSGVYNNTNSVDVYGTADGRTFDNYKLFYKNGNEWVKIHENTSSVSYGLLYSWNISSVQKDTTYYLKLEVNSLNQTSTDLTLVTIGNTSNNDGIIIEVNSSVNESESFVVSLFDENYYPTSAFVLFYTPMHLPKLRYGHEVTFNAPNIYIPLFDSLDSKIYVYKVLDKKLYQTELQVLNVN